jgi:hypothetical protein
VLVGFLPSPPYASPANSSHWSQSRGALSPRAASWLRGILPPNFPEGKAEKAQSVTCEEFQPHRGREMATWSNQKSQRGLLNGERTCRMWGGDWKGEAVSECLCPQNPYIKILPSKVVVLGGGASELSHKEGSLRSRISALNERGLVETPTTLLPCEDTVRRHHL